MLSRATAELYELCDARVGILEALIETKRATLNEVLDELDRRVDAHTLTDLA
jgi:hypothetical protein